MSESEHLWLARFHFEAISFCGHLGACSTDSGTQRVQSLLRCTVSSHPYTHRKINSYTHRKINSYTHRKINSYKYRKINSYKYRKINLYKYRKINSYKCRKINLYKRRKISLYKRRKTNCCLSRAGKKTHYMSPIYCRL